MKTLLIGVVLFISTCLLIYVMARGRLPLNWFMMCALHLSTAIMAVYIINYSGWITGVYIPVNLTTVSIVTVLGLPGVGLLLGLKMCMF